MRNPYVTGSFVIGSKHYGRAELIDCLLRGEGRAYWVVGNRRIGKTSLLRQLEVISSQPASASPSHASLVPLFWDMQGSGSFACLGRYLLDAVRDRAERFEALGMTPDQMEEEDALALLASLRRLAMRAGRELFLLCDETEVLVNIARTEPEAMQRLHQQLTGGAGLRVVMTSTRQIYRMHDICRDWPTSSFLAGFDMSYTLGSLSATSAEELIVQAQEPEGQRVHASSELINSICHATNNHPLLLQMLCSRLFSGDGTLSPIADEHLRVDPLLAGFFEHDFRLLTDADRRILLAVHRGRAIETAELASLAGEEPGELEHRLHDLDGLGYLRRVYPMESGSSAAGVEQRNPVMIGNLFLSNWLSFKGESLRAMPSLQTSDEAMRKAFARQQPNDASSLAAQLNARRSRLAELEVVRAQEFLTAPAEVFNEIDQLQTEISELRSLLERRRL